MAEVVRKIPDQLSSLTTSSGGQYMLQDNLYDFAIAGQPFLSAISDARPHTNRMAPIRKEQFDNFAEPGEQSLQGWWLRSQSNFTGGAGVLYQDPDTDNQFNLRFATSLGINPWTPGSLQLLRQTTVGLARSLTNNRVQGYVTSGLIDAYWDMDANNFSKVTDSGTTAILTATADVLFDLSSTGDTYILITSTGIYKGTDAGARTQIYNTANANGLIEFVKDRLIACVGPSVYQLALSPAGAPVGLPATPEYTHQSPNWRWRSITEGPTAIYIAGDDGVTSQVHKFSLSVDSGGLPQLDWVGVTATMPAGETINTIYSYVQSFVGIATSKGFRVGEIDGSGEITYGPLLFTPPGGCAGITGFDTFMWTGSTADHAGNSGLYRVDLGSSVQEQTTRAVRYAYARDIYATGPVNAVTSITNFGKSNRVVYAVNLTGSFKEQATELLPNGSIDTGRIRFNTEEPKLYKFFSVRTASPLLGNVAASILSEGGGVIPAITYGPSSNAGVKDVGISSPIGPQNWLALRFTLFRDPSIVSRGGVMNGWQVKALPGSIRQRIITHPFLLLDNEKDKGGQRIGYDGYTQERLSQFEATARAGDVVLFQELAAQLVTQVVIDDFEFQQIGPPGPNGPTGGYLTVVMRTVAEST